MAVSVSGTVAALARVLRASRTVSIDETIDTLARTLWGEAEGEGAIGMHAVASVILNRVKQPSWWGTDIESVCMKPYQFSCRNPGEPRREKLLAVTTEDNAFRVALGIARQAVAGELQDIVHGADSYYAEGIRAPAWAIGKTPVAVVGRHRFYRTVAERAA